MTTSTGYAEHASRLLSRAELRDAVRGVRAADTGAVARRARRPPGAIWLFRSRLRLRGALDLAARDGRLVWDSADRFCVLMPPPLDASATGLRPLDLRTRRLRFLDRYRDVLAFAIPPAAMLLAAAVVAVATGLGPFRSSTSVLGVVAGLAIAAAAWVVLLQLAHILLLARVSWVSRSRRTGRPWSRSCPGSGASNCCTRPAWRTPSLSSIGRAGSAPGREGTSASDIPSSCQRTR